MTSLDRGAIGFNELSASDHPRRRAPGCAVGNVLLMAFYVADARQPYRWMSTSTTRRRCRSAHLQRRLPETLPTTTSFATIASTTSRRTGSLAQAMGHHGCRRQQSPDLQQCDLRHQCQQRQSRRMPRSILYGARNSEVYNNTRLRQRRVGDCGRGRRRLARSSATTSATVIVTVTTPIMVAVLSNQTTCSPILVS